MDLQQMSIYQQLTWRSMFGDLIAHITHWKNQWELFTLQDYSMGTICPVGLFALQDYVTHTCFLVVSYTVA